MLSALSFANPTSYLISLSEIFTRKLRKRNHKISAHENLIVTIENTCPNKEAALRQLHTILHTLPHHGATCRHQVRYDIAPGLNCYCYSAIVTNSSRQCTSR